MSKRSADPDESYTCCPSATYRKYSRKVSEFLLIDKSEILLFGQIAGLESELSRQNAQNKRIDCENVFE